MREIVHYMIAKPFPVAVDSGILTRKEEEEALKNADGGKRSGGGMRMYNLHDASEVEQRHARYIQSNSNNQDQY